MKTIAYQQKYVKELTEKVVDLLNLSGNRHKLVFKAPTGSGKTVMASQMLDQLSAELAGRSDVSVRHVAFMWIAPNKLHEQSYMKMKNFFSETRVLRPVMFDELDHGEGIIQEGEVLFVNWESINKDKNVMVRDNEQNKSMFDVARRTQEEAGLPIVVVIDEEHTFWSKTADKSEEVLRRINPKVEVRISATPKTQNCNIVIIPREEVIRAEMIKEGVVLNPDVSKDINDYNSLTQHLIDKAMQKRNEIAEAYKALGVRINPLLLIQLPNDKESLSSEDVQLKETISTYLEHTAWDTSVANGRMAIWLSQEKENMEGIEKYDSMVNVLLFKQAIAYGWDCPRAAVLLIFRKLESFEFTVQTVGRILRMPEQHFYQNDLLNKGYVYTDISADKIKIVQDDMDYMTKLYAKRRENLVNVCLKSVYSERRSEERNRLGSDFKRVLTQTFVNEWQLESGDFPSSATNTASKNREIVATNRHIQFDVQNIVVEIPENVMLNIEGETDLREHKMKYAKTSYEIKRTFEDFCSKQLSGFEKSRCIDVLENYLLEVLETLFELRNTDAMKVVLNNKNQDKFADIVQIALCRYAEILAKRKDAAKQRSFRQVDWEVPEDRLYNEQSNVAVPNVENHALMPFVRQKNASNPEMDFATYLEENMEYIDWWYKNGDEGRQHYAIEYVRTDGGKGLFYVDFVIRMKSGKIFLFDTKTTNSDMEAPAKHNALIAYMKQHADQGLHGGIVIHDNGLWKYCPETIDSTKINGKWVTWCPDMN